MNNSFLNLDLKLAAAEAHLSRNFALAQEYYNQILSHEPDNDEIWVNSGEAHLNLGQLPQALAALERAAALNPRNTLAWYNLAFIHAGQWNWVPAEAAIAQAIALDGRMAESHFIQGNILRSTGRHDAAIEAYKQSLRIQEGNAEAWSNLGITFYEVGDFDSAAGAYLNALRYNINLVSAHANLAIVLLQVGKLVGARRSAERALALDPNNAAALNTLGCVFSQMGDHEVALGYYRSAVTLAPDFWKAHSNLLFCLLHKEGTRLPEVHAMHHEWYMAHGLPHVRPAPHFPNPKDPEKRLRVGLVSGDYRSHPVAYFIFNTYSRLVTENALDVFLYANQYEETEPFALRFRNLAGDRWRPIWEQKTEDVLAQIARDEIDILIDLTGHNDRHRLDIFCARAAPVQVTWAGYMATTGLPQMDWLLGDQHQTPASDQPYYTERLYQMPHSFICYMPPPDAPPLAGEPPCTTRGFVTFASFNKPTKITDRAIRLWSEVMHRTPNSRLLLKFIGLGDEEATRSFTERFAAHGIDPERLIYEANSPHVELLNRYNDVDIALDPVPYTGSTTTLESLWMSTPLVTLPGAIFPARHSSTYLHSIGAPELIARDETDYVEKIVALATDTARLRHYKQTLRAQMAASPLCDQSQFVPAFTAALRHFWRTYCGS